MNTFATGFVRRSGSSLALALQVAIFGCLLAGPAGAAPAWYTNNVGGFNPNIPDFYQHQNWSSTVANGWESATGRSGWCQFVAFADVFYDLTKQGYTNLLNADITNGAKWFDTAYKPGDVANSNIFKLTGAMSGKTVQQYLDATGHKADDATAPLVSNLFGVDANGKVNGTTMSLFDFYKTKMKAGDQVLLKLGPGTTTHEPGTAPNYKQGRWWTNFHFVAGAGLDEANSVAFIADPDTNRGSALANAGWPNNNKFPGEPPAGGASFGLKSVNTDPTPIPGAPDRTNAASYSTYYSGFKLNDKNKITSLDSPQYDGTIITHVSIISAPKGKLTSAIPLGGKTQTTIALSSGTETVDKIFILPNAGVADPIVDGSLFSLISSDDTWNVTRQFQDPFGFSGVGIQYDLTSGSGLTPGEAAFATLGTDADFSDTGFKILLHFLGDPSDIWDIEFVGSQSDVPDFQLVPEPTAMLSLLIGAGVMLGRRRRS